MVQLNVSLRRMLWLVERSYCMRPILCLTSSKILTPHPPHCPASVYPPPLVRGEDKLAGWRRGWGVNILKDAGHSSVLYICKCFVLWLLPPPPSPISKLYQRHTGRLKKRDNLLTGEGDGVGKEQTHTVQLARRSGPL